MTSEHAGGPEPHPDRDDYVQLRIATCAWRLRLGVGTVAVVYLMAGESTALLFAAALGASTLVYAGGAALARFEARHRARRVAR